MQPQEPKPWGESQEGRLPIFPTVLLPEKWGKLVTDFARAVVVPVDYVACALMGTASSGIVGRIDVRPRDVPSVDRDRYYAMIAAAYNNGEFASVRVTYIRPTRETIYELMPPGVDFMKYEGGIV